MSNLNFNELNNDLGPEDNTFVLKAEISELNDYSDRKSYAKGLVDIALLTANANQLKHAIAIDDLTYKIVNICLVITSITLQVSFIVSTSLKITLKSHFTTLRAKRATFFFLREKSLILRNLLKPSNSPTSQNSPNSQKTAKFANFINSLYSTKPSNKLISQFL